MEAAQRPRILVLDHLDSFVHNLARYLTCSGAEAIVRRADSVTTDECIEFQPNGVLLSPGPRGPSDTKVAIDWLRQTNYRVPTLGVCLGHQAIAASFGAIIQTGPPMHGMADQIEHDGLGVYAGCPSPISVARYHSLRVRSEPLPQDWIVTATNRDGVIMGIRHRCGLVEGVQFHPESILTQYGQRMIDNFVGLCRKDSGAAQRIATAVPLDR